MRAIVARALGRSRHHGARRLRWALAAAQGLDPAHYPRGEVDRALAEAQLALALLREQQGELIEASVWEKRACRFYRLAGLAEVNLDGERRRLEP